MTQIQTLSYLKARETRSREQAANAVEICARMAHLAIAKSYSIRIAVIVRADLPA